MQIDISDGGGHRASYAVRLGSINRWLKFTGFRLFVASEPDDENPSLPWTTIGIAWYGLPKSAGWHRIEGKS